MNSMKKGRCPVCHRQRVYTRLSDDRGVYSGSHVSHYLCADCGYTEQYVHNTGIINDPAWQPVDMPVFSARKQEQESRRLYHLAAQQSELYHEERHPSYGDDKHNFLPRSIQLTVYNEGENE